MDRFQQALSGAEPGGGDGQDCYSRKQQGESSGRCEQVATEVGDGKRRQHERHALAPAFDGAVADPKDEGPLEKVR